MSNYLAMTSLQMDLQPGQNIMLLPTVTAPALTLPCMEN